MLFDVEKVDSMMTTFDNTGWEILSTSPLGYSIEVEINYSYTDGNSSIFDEGKLLSKIAARYKLNQNSLSTQINYDDNVYIQSIIILGGVNKTKPIFVLVNHDFVDPADDIKEKRRQQIYEDEEEEYMNSLAYGAIRSRHKIKKQPKFKKDW